MLNTITQFFHKMTTFKLLLTGEIKTVEIEYGVFILKDSISGLIQVNAEIKLLVCIFS